MTTTTTTSTTTTTATTTTTPFPARGCVKSRKDVPTALAQHPRDLPCRLKMHEIHRADFKCTRRFIALCRPVPCLTGLSSKQQRGQIWQYILLAEDSPLGHGTSPLSAFQHLVHLQSARWTSCILSPHGRSRAFCVSTEGKPFAAPHASCWDASLGHNVTQNKHNLHRGLPLRFRNFLTSSFWPISPASFHTILFKLKLSQRLYTESQSGTQNNDYKYKRHFILSTWKIQFSALRRS